MASIRSRIGENMTESEAIKEVRFNMSTIGLSDKAAKRVVEARNVAIKALEKQIPKKPTPIDYEKYIDVIDNARLLRGAYWCPNCKRVVKSGSFCNDCGQKLDWSDEE